MYVEHFKYLLLLQNTDALKAVYAEDKKSVSHHTCNGVVMDAATHQILSSLVKDLKGKQAELFKHYAGDYMTAEMELIEEISTTGKVPVIDIHKRRSKSTGIIDFSDLDDEDFDEEEEYHPDPTDEEEEEEVVAKAVSKPIVEKKTQAKPKREVAKPKEEPVVKKDSPKESVKAEVKEAVKKPRGRAAKKAAAPSTSTEPAESPSTPVDLTNDA